MRIGILSILLLGMGFVDSAFTSESNNTQVPSPCFNTAHQTPRSVELVILDLLKNWLSHAPSVDNILSARNNLLNHQNPFREGFDVINEQHSKVMEQILDKNKNLKWSSILSEFDQLIGLELDVQKEIETIDQTARKAIGGFRELPISLEENRNFIRSPKSFVTPAGVQYVVLDQTIYAKNSRNLTIYEFQPKIYRFDSESAKLEYISDIAVRPKSQPFGSVSNSWPQIRGPLTPVDEDRVLTYYIGEKSYLVIINIKTGQFEKLVYIPSTAPHIFTSEIIVTSEEDIYFSIQSENGTSHSFYHVNLKNSSPSVIKTITHEKSSSHSVLKHDDNGHIYWFVTTTSSEDNAAKMNLFIHTFHLEKQMFDTEVAEVSIILDDLSNSFSSTSMTTLQRHSGNWLLRLIAEKTVHDFEFDPVKNTVSPLQIDTYIHQSVMRINTTLSMEGNSELLTSAIHFGGWSELRVVKLDGQAATEVASITFPKNARIKRLISWLKNHEDRLFAIVEFDPLSAPFAYQLIEFDPTSNSLIGLSPFEFETYSPVDRTAPHPLISQDGTIRIMGASPDKTIKVIEVDSGDR